MADCGHFVCFVRSYCVQETVRLQIPRTLLSPSLVFSRMRGCGCVWRGGGCWGGAGAEYTEQMVHGSCNTAFERLLAFMEHTKCKTVDGGHRKRTQEEMRSTTMEYNSIINRDDKYNFERMRWSPSRSYYCYSLKIERKQIGVYAYTYNNAVDMDKLVVEAADACNSVNVQRKRKQEMVANLQHKRQRDVNKFGGNCDMERDSLLRIQRHVMQEESTEGLIIFILRDGCRSDALFRTCALPPEKWIKYQQKTTAGPCCSGSGQSSVSWKFTHLRPGGYAYESTLVVCESQSDGKLWAFDGPSILTDGIRITQKEDGKFCQDRIPLAGYESLKERMIEECRNSAINKPGSKEPVTIAEAEKEVGSKHAVEYDGVDSYIRTQLGGLNDIEPSLYTNGSKNDILEALNLRVCTNGHTVQFPTEQNGKTDLLVSHDGNIERLQFKTGKHHSDCKGFAVDMRSNNGKSLDGKHVMINSYKPGDNDFYVVVLPEAHGTTIWKLPDAEMQKYGLVGERAPDGFYVYKNTATKSKYSWTANYVL